jgi:hypothetical protein
VFEIAVLRFIQAPFVEKKQSLAELQHKEKQLDIQGFSEQGDVMFQYKNEAQNITQIFGISLKKYIGGTHKEHAWYENTVGYSKCDDMNYSNETKDYDGPQD